MIQTGSFNRRKLSVFRPVHAATFSLSCVQSCRCKTVVHLITGGSRLIQTNKTEQNVRIKSADKSVNSKRSSNFPLIRIFRVRIHRVPPVFPMSQWHCSPCACACTMVFYLLKCNQTHKPKPWQGEKVVDSCVLSTMGTSQELEKRMGLKTQQENTGWSLHDVSFQCCVAAKAEQITFPAAETHSHL